MWRNPLCKGIFCQMAGLNSEFIGPFLPVIVSQNTVTGYLKDSITPWFNPWNAEMVLYKPK